MIKNWLKSAFADRGITLGLFNALNEISWHNFRVLRRRAGTIDESTLSKAYASFDGFLKRNPSIPQPDALRAFFDNCDEDERYGEPVQVPEQFAGIKGFGGFPEDSDGYEIALLGLSRAECEAAMSEIDDIVANAISARADSGGFTDFEKQQIDSILRAKFTKSMRVVNDALARRSTAQRDGDVFVPDDCSDELIWLTRKSDLEDECSEPSDPTNGLLRSGYICSVRRELGLSTRHDKASDLKSIMRYRLFLKMSVDLPPDCLDKVHQPNLFSQGFEDLFVSRMPLEATVDPLSGRTVRLVDDKCDHGGGDYNSCSLCGAPGLPEAVLHRSDLFEHGEIEFEGAYPAFAGDLAQYSVPEPHMIRSKNPFDPMGVLNARD